MPLIPFDIIKAKQDFANSIFIAFDKIIFNYSVLLETLKAHHYDGKPYFANGLYLANESDLANFRSRLLLIDQQYREVPSGASFDQTELNKLIHELSDQLCKALSLISESIPSKGIDPGGIRNLLEIGKKAVIETHDKLLQTRADLPVISEQEDIAFKAALLQIENSIFTIDMEVRPSITRFVAECIRFFKQVLNSCPSLFTLEMCKALREIEDCNIALNRGQNEKLSDLVTKLRQFFSDLSRYCPREEITAAKEAFDIWSDQFCQSAILQNEKVVFPHDQYCYLVELQECVRASFSSFLNALQIEKASIENDYFKTPTLKQKKALQRTCSNPFMIGALDILEKSRAYNPNYEFIIKDYLNWSKAALVELFLILESIDSREIAAAVKNCYLVRQALIESTVARNKQKLGVYYPEVLTLVASNVLASHWLKKISKEVKSDLNVLSERLPYLSACRKKQNDSSVINAVFEFISIPENAALTPEELVLKLKDIQNRLLRDIAKVFNDLPAYQKAGSVAVTPITEVKLIKIFAEIGKEYFNKYLAFTFACLPVVISISWQLMDPELRNLFLVWKARDLLLPPVVEKCFGSNAQLASRKVVSALQAITPEKYHSLLKMLQMDSFSGINHSGALTKMLGLLLIAGTSVVSGGAVVPAMMTFMTVDMIANVVGSIVPNISRYFNLSPAGAKGLEAVAQIGTRWAVAKPVSWGSHKLCGGASNLYGGVYNWFWSETRVALAPEKPAYMITKYEQEFNAEKIRLGLDDCVSDAACHRLMYANHPDKNKGFNKLTWEVISTVCTR